MKPEVPKGGHGGLRVRVIAGGDQPRLVGTHQQLADGPDRHLAVELVGDPELEPGHRPAGDGGVGDAEGCGQRDVDLGGAVAGSDPDAEAAPEVLQVGDQRDEHDPVKGVVGVVRPGCLAGEEVCHRAEQEAHRGTGFPHD